MSFGIIVEEYPNTSKMEPSWGDTNTTPAAVGAQNTVRPFVSNDTLTSNIDATKSGMRGMSKKNLVMLAVVGFILWKFWPGR